MNRYGLVLNQIGLEPAITELQQRYLVPLQGALYPDEGSEADDHHAFIVRYKADEDVGLDMHEDDSDVTLNVCLGKEFTASTLLFCGMVPEDNHRQLQQTYSHMKGRAVLHLGRHRHGADNIETGERVNLILWSTSEVYRKSKAFQKHRTASLTAKPPHKLCLSYTHDLDYTDRLALPTKDEGLKRGVMYDFLQLRQNLVRDLETNLPELYGAPSACLFLEGLATGLRFALWRGFTRLALNLEEQRKTGTHYSHWRLKNMQFFVAETVQGQVPAIRRLCGVQGSPAFVILDCKQQLRYICPGTLTASVMQRFVEDFVGDQLLGDKISEDAGHGALLGREVSSDSSEEDIFEDMPELEPQPI